MNSNFWARLILCGVMLTMSGVFAEAQWLVAPQSQTQDDLNTVFFADSKRGWVAGDGGYLAWTNDGGRTWTRQRIATTEPISDVYFRGSDKGYVIAGEKVFSSTDGGENWREEKILLASEIVEGKPELTSLRFADKKNGWIVGFVNKNNAVISNLVLHSSDGGSLWRRVRVPATEELIHLDFAGDERGWIVGANGTILATDDGGATWRRQRSGTTDAIYHIEFRDENTGFAVGAKGLILTTANGGATWQKVASGVTKALLTVKFVNDKNGWIAGRGGTLLRSDDGGKTWVKQEIKTAENLFALYIDKKIGCAVGGKGTILRFER